MAKYGNIMAVFHVDQPTTTSIETMLRDLKTEFVLCEGLYFVETNSKKNTLEVINAMNGLGVQYVFFHNNIADGSLVKSNGIDKAMVGKINKIMLR
jgi:hypothetical protein